MRISTICVQAPVRQGYRIALISDTHSQFPEGLQAALAKEKPDVIAIAGDLVDCSNTLARSQNVLEFLSFCASMAPTFYSLGNHEGEMRGRDIRAAAKTGAVVLDNASFRYKEMNIGGFSSEYKYLRASCEGEKKTAIRKKSAPDVNWLKSYAAGSGYKVLLCHHPEYYERYIRELDIDLVLSGHAHGGQIRLFGHGLFAPGQGVLPKYTSGLYDGRLIVSRGLCNTARPIPRLWNETELVMITVSPRG